MHPAPIVNPLPFWLELPRLGVGRSSLRVSVWAPCAGPSARAMDAFLAMRNPFAGGERSTPAGTDAEAPIDIYADLVDHEATAEDPRRQPDEVDVEVASFMGDPRRHSEIAEAIGDDGYDRYDGCYGADVAVDEAFEGDAEAVVEEAVEEDAGTPDSPSMGVSFDDEAFEEQEGEPLPMPRPGLPTAAGAPSQSSPPAPAPSISWMPPAPKAGWATYYPGPLGSPRQLGAYTVPTQLYQAAPAPSVSPLYIERQPGVAPVALQPPPTPAAAVRSGPPIVRSGVQGGEQRTGGSGGSERQYYRGYYGAKGQGKAALLRYVRINGPPPTQGGTPWHGPAMADRKAAGKAKGKGRRGKGT